MLSKRLQTAKSKGCSKLAAAIKDRPLQLSVCRIKALTARFISVTSRDSHPACGQSIKFIKDNGIAPICE
ncbi:MAG: hypothetical protein LBP22_03550 [Deltaproteobacteria bacterium]|nr:hypothetical protein [Deltaproteobacteria bacterium]